MRSCLAAVLVALVGLSGTDVGAVGFDYALDELRVTGNLEFLDDFEDGSRTSPPTSSLQDWRGTRATEAGGYLVLDSDNGFYPRPDLGRDLHWLMGLVELVPPIVDGGSGTTTISASFRPDVPGSGFDGRMYEHYAIAAGTEGSQSVELGIASWFVGVLNVTFSDNRRFAAGEDDILGQHFLPTSSITGNIVLELVVDHATDTVTPRFSVDGGTTFIEATDWGNPAEPGPVFDTGDVAFAAYFGFGPAAGAAPVEIDVRPLNDEPNTILARPGWPVLVALLGADGVDVTAMNADSFAFGPGGAAPAHRWQATEDVDGDGVSDLLTRYPYGDTGLTLGPQEACLMGRLDDGRLFRGCDTVSVVEPPCGLGYELALLLFALRFAPR